MLVLAIAGSDAKPPPSIDWRDVPGIVNPVRDQGLYEARLTLLRHIADVQRICVPDYL